MEIGVAVCFACQGSNGKTLKYVLVTEPKLESYIDVTGENVSGDNG